MVSCPLHLDLVILLYEPKDLPPRTLLFLINQIASRAILWTNKWNKFYCTYLRCLWCFLNLESFYAIKELKKLQKSFHGIFLWSQCRLFLSSSCVQFTLRKWQQKKASLPVIHRLRKEKQKLDAAPRILKVLVTQIIFRKLVYT